MNNNNLNNNTTSFLNYLNISADRGNNIAKQVKTKLMDENQNIFKNIINHTHNNNKII